MKRFHKDKKASRHYVATGRTQNPNIPGAGRDGAAHGGGAGGLERAGLELAGPGRGGAGRGGSGRGGAGQGGKGRRRVGAPRKQPSILPSREPKTTLLDISSEARTNEILCKPNRGTQRAVDDRLTSG